MTSSVTKAGRFWMILFIACCVFCAAAGYLLTTYKSQELRQLILENTKQLNTPMPELPESLNELIPSPPVDKLLSTIAQRYPIDIHYKRSSHSSDVWVVSIKAMSRQAIRFVANIAGSQHQQYSHYPETETIQWESLKSNSDDAYGILQWQFHWQANSAAHHLEQPIHTTHSEPVNVPTLSCYDKPLSSAQQSFAFREITDTSLTAIQTSPVRKAVFKANSERFVTAFEGDWLAKQIQLDAINPDNITLSHWQRAGNCWHKHSQQLRINKESNAS